MPFTRTKGDGFRKLNQGFTSDVKLDSTVVALSFDFGA